MTKKTLKQGSESFDIWSKAQFHLWSNVRYDFELIAELTRTTHSTRNVLELLNTVNSYLKNPQEKTLFDGTIKCLKFLIRNSYLDIKDLPTSTFEQKMLVDLLSKYSKRLDITDIVSDIEEPTLRGMLLEYPNLLPEMFKNHNPIAGNELGKALLKHGITDEKTLLEKVDSGQDAIEVDKDKNSKEAMKCKLIYLGLFIANGKIHISHNSSNLINELSTLTDEAIEKDEYSKSVFNSLYTPIYGQSEWNKEKRVALTGCDILNMNFQLLFYPDNHMSLIYEMFLKEEVDKIGAKYFGTEYKPGSFIASLAIRMAMLIVMFRAENFIPEGEKRDVELFSAGAMLGGLNYGVEKNGKNSLKLKRWFLDYFRDELDKRVAFIKMQVDNDVAIVDWSEKRVIYLPVFESFRFFCNRAGFLGDIIKLFKNKDIPNTVKDEIFINFALNIQKIVADKDREDSKDEEWIKDTFIILLSQTFEGLVVKTSLSLKYQAQKYYEGNDLIGDGILGMIELILGFDLSKNNSFIGYIKKNLELKVRTTSRRLKKNDDILTISEKEFEEGFLESIPDATDLIATIEDEDNINKIKDYINRLPEKERAAVRKMIESNETLTDTERKAKNRGLSKIRELMNHS